MRKSYTYRSQALRFRRWSRKAYAAFISIQRAVTIGELSFSVADRFEKKNQSLHTGIGTFTNGFFEEDDEDKELIEQDPRILALSQGLFAALLPALASNEIAHPAHRVAHYTLYNIVKAGSILWDTFRLSYFYPVGVSNIGILGTCVCHLP
ncbi:hypothetical protein [Parabacteroides sp.]|uniref:hypothetical protein n=1 Tax=Parabacteroides sp. TaxID=1869337 RepID=UPI00257BA452|nr:hypothetical protein [Parabacteroides sp.]